MKRFLVMLLMALIVAAPGYARGKKKSASTEPGKYKEWGPDIDELEIVKSFDAADYTAIAVEELDTEDAPLPEKDDNTYVPVTKVLESATEGFVQGLRGAVDQKVTIGKGKGAGTLVIRGRVETMDPGSKAARYWAGFGAGAARAKLVLELVDGKSNEVLARLTQERRSGSGFDAFGGNYEELMRRNLIAIGEDVANVLELF